MRTKSRRAGIGGDFASKHGADRPGRFRLTRAANTTSGRAGRPEFGRPAGRNNTLQAEAVLQQRSYAAALAKGVLLGRMLGLPQE
jgi:hypothetical protein